MEIVDCRSQKADLRFEFVDLLFGDGLQISAIGFAKSSQIQNQLSINAIAQIRCSRSYQWFLFVFNCFIIDTIKMPSIRIEHFFIFCI
jgi:hypothetical protein